MKQIFAIIRIDKMTKTKLALSDVGLPSFTAMPVVGRGKGTGDIEALKKLVIDDNSELDPEMHRLKSKRMIVLIVSDDKKELAVETILKVNQTGQKGDGKIFITPVVDSIRVRTGETGDITLD